MKLGGELLARECGASNIHGALASDAGRVLREGFAPYLIDHHCQFLRLWRSPLTYARHQCARKQIGPFLHYIRHNMKDVSGAGSQR